MRIRLVSLCLIASAAVILAQSDRGTITGTVADPAGAVVANAPIEAKNTQTGAVFQAASSDTGNYTLPQLPVGIYEISVAVAGFKKYVRQNITVGVAQTVRVDIVARSRLGGGIGNGIGAVVAAQNRKWRDEHYRSGAAHDRPGRSGHRRNVFHQPGSSNLSV